MGLTDERQKLSLSHFAFAIALLSGWGPTSSTHLSFILVFSLVPRNFSLGDEPFGEPFAGMSEGYGQLVLLNAVRSQRGLLILSVPQCVTALSLRGVNNFLARRWEWPLLLASTLEVPSPSVKNAINMRMIFLLILFLSFSFCLCSFTNLQSIDASHHASKISICTLDQWLCEFIDLYIYNEQRDISDRYMRKIIKLNMEKQQVGDEVDEDGQDEED